MCQGIKHRKQHYKSIITAIAVGPITTETLTYRGNERQSTTHNVYVVQ